jgi:3-oxoadipate enol-lactonase
VTATVFAVPASAGPAAVLAIGVTTSGSPQSDGPRDGSQEAAARNTVKVMGGELCYEAKGNGAPVVLLHAGLLDQRMWDEQFALLAKQYRVIRFDARGHGCSSLPTGEFSNYEDLHQLLVALDVPRATLVGLSLGARTAVDFALAYPEMVVAVVAVSPGISGWGFHDPKLAENDRGAQAAWAAGDRAGVVEWFQRSWTDGPKRRPGEVDLKVRERVRLMATETMAKGATSGQLRERDAARHLKDIHVPLLVIVGDLDMLDTHEIADQLVASVPGARKAVVRGAGHMVNLEQPAELDRLLLEHLQDREAVGQRPR